MQVILFLPFFICDKASQNRLKTINWCRLFYFECNLRNRNSWNGQKMKKVHMNVNLNVYVKREREKVSEFKWVCLCLSYLEYVLMNKGERERIELASDKLYARESVCDCLWHLERTVCLRKRDCRRICLLRAALEENFFFHLALDDCSHFESSNYWFRSHRKWKSH